MKTTKTTGPQTVKRIVLALASAGLASLPQLSQANPEGGQVVAGSATIRQETPNKVAVSQTTAKAIVDWRSFSVGANEQIQFYQPSASSVTLNRVVGEDPSKILGRLTANGQVFLVNPNGIYFGKGSQIDVAGLVASTHNIRNEDFLAGKYLFNIQGKPDAAVINEGTIRVADTGIAAFVAPSVANRGLIVAKLGKIALAAANGFTLDFTGDELLTFLVSDEIAKTAFDIEGKQLTSFVENSGRIEAQGGHVLLTAKAAENAIHGVINQTGVIEATTVGTQNGEIILNAGKGSLNVSGTLDASAPNGGNGGFVETSGSHVTIDPNAKITTTAPYGKYGTWLIDPNDFTIAAVGGNITGASLSSNLASNNVVIQTATAGTPGGNGDIFVSDSVAWNANTHLTLRADRDVHINNDITASSNSTVSVFAPGTVYVAATATAGFVTYIVNDAELTGITRSLSSVMGDTISILPYSPTTPVRIESSHTANTLSLTPSELGTLRASGGIAVGGYVGTNSDLTVSASIDSSNVHSGLSLTGRNVTINSPINLTNPNSPVSASASDTLFVNADVTGTGDNSSGGVGPSVEYKANSMALRGITTASDSYIWIGPYDQHRPIRIESTPTTGTLSLTPADLATLRVNPNNFENIYLSTAGDITVAAALTGNQIDSSTFQLWAVGAGKIKIDAPITGGERLQSIVLLADSDITINAPITPTPQAISSSGVIKYYDSQVLTPAQQQLVNDHKNDNPAMLLNAIGAGLFSNSAQDPVWVGMYQNGSATPAQVTASSLWPTYDKYRSATASKILEGLQSGEIVHGDTIWTALGSPTWGNMNNRNEAYYTFTHPTPPTSLTAAQQQLVNAHKNDSTFQLLTAIADGLFTNSNTDPIWVGLYQNGAATPVQVEANRLRNIYDHYTAADIFSLILKGDLKNDSNNSEWHSLYRNGQAMQSQVDADAFANTYSQYRRATADTLFSGIVSGSLNPVTGNVVWQALAQQNLSGTNKAAQMYLVFKDLRNASEGKLLEALTKGDLVYGSTIWTALGTTNLWNRDAAYNTFTHPAPTLSVVQQKLIDFYKGRPAEDLFWGLVSTDPLRQLKNASTDPVWHALYVDGRPTPAQQSADAYKRIFDNFRNAGPDRLLQALKNRDLVRQGVVWEALTEVNEYGTRTALANYMTYLANNSETLPNDPTGDRVVNAPKPDVSDNGYNPDLRNPYTNSLTWHQSQLLSIARNGSVFDLLALFTSGDMEHGDALWNALANNPNRAEAYRMFLADRPTVIAQIEKHQPRLFGLTNSVNLPGGASVSWPLGYLVDDIKETWYSNGSVVLEFPVYNDRSIYAAFEVLDKDGNVVSTELAAPKLLATSATDYWKDQISSIESGEGIKNSFVSQKTDITLRVPEGGSVRMSYSANQALAANVLGNIVDAIATFLPIPKGTSKSVLDRQFKTLAMEFVKSQAFDYLKLLAKGEITFNNFLEKLNDTLAVDKQLLNALAAIFPAVAQGNKVVPGGFVKLANRSGLNALDTAAKVLTSSLNATDAGLAFMQDQSAYNGTITPVHP